MFVWNILRVGLRAAPLFITFAKEQHSETRGGVLF